MLTRGRDNKMRLNNPNGYLVKLVQNYSGNVSQSGEQDYTGNSRRTVNKDEDNIDSDSDQSTDVFFVCSTYTDDFLNVIYSNECKQTTDVRYSCSTENQIIQFSDKNILCIQVITSQNYMIDLYIMYMDICVADHLARTGMFVYQTGKL